MSIGLVFMMSLAAVGAALTTLIRTIGLRRVLRHSTKVDVIFTVMTCLALAGSLTGILIGIVAGLVMTGTLTVLKAFTGALDTVRADHAKPVAEAEDWCPGGTPEKL